MVLANRHDLVFYIIMVFFCCVIIFIVDEQVHKNECKILAVKSGIFKFLKAFLCGNDCMK